MNRKVTDVEINIGFQAESFVAVLVCSLLAALFGYFLFAINLGRSGILVWIGVYLIPSAVAFYTAEFLDDEYKQLNLEDVCHPSRFLILTINLFLGFTVIGWLFALFLAFKPGLVLAKRVELVESEKQ